MSANLEPTRCCAGGCLSDGAVLQVLLLDDHRVVREGLRSLIDAEPDMAVVGDYGDVDSLLAAARTRRCDVAVIDLEVPRGSGLAAVRGLASIDARVRCLILTAHEQADRFRAAIDAGAVGFVAKRVASDELLLAIRAVGGGRTHFAVSLSGPTRTPSSEATDPGAVAILSEREREVLKLIARGYTNKEAAGKLYLSVKTVEGYRARLVRKLDAPSRRALVAVARRAGFLEPEDGFSRT